MRRAAARIALALAAALGAAAAPAKLVVMHGYADSTSALVWIQADAPGPIAIAWRPEGAAAERRIELASERERQNVVVARLDGLAPGGRASYRIAGDGDGREGAVRAQPRVDDPGNPAAITIASGSCYFLSDSDAPAERHRAFGAGYEIFDAIAGEAPRRDAVAGGQRLPAAPRVLRRGGDGATTPRPLVPQIVSTSTPRPTSTPTKGIDKPFTLAGQDTVCDAALEPGLLQFSFMDSRRNQVAGIQIIVTWGEGEDNLFTGFKPEIGDGYADFIMQADTVYSIHVVDGGSFVPNISAPIRTNDNGGSYLGGLLLTFQQP